MGFGGGVHAAFVSIAVGGVDAEYSVVEFSGEESWCVSAIVGSRCEEDHSFFFGIFDRFFDGWLIAEKGEGHGDDVSIHIGRHCPLNCLILFVRLIMYSILDHIPGRLALVPLPPDLSKSSQCRDPLPEQFLKSKKRHPCHVQMNQQHLSPQ